MGTVIYSATPVATFMGSAGTILLLLALGVFGFASALFQRNQKLPSRLAIGAAGAILLIASGAMALTTLTSATNKTRTVVLSLYRKQVALDNCNNGQTCTRYVLEAVTSTTAYDFDVSKDAYDKAAVNTCYQFTYYPNTGLSASDSAAYQQIDNIARIETADPARCQ